MRYSLLFCCLVAPSGSAQTAKEAPADDALTQLTERLRTATDLRVPNSKENASRLARIGLAQVRIKDVKGALKTLEAIRNNQQWDTRDFFEELAALQART